MIECSNCSLPTLPAAIFWEKMLNTRMPCVCGSMDRARVDVIRKVSAVTVITLDMLDELRAGDEGMPEKIQRAEPAVMSAPATEIDRLDELRASAEGMPDAGQHMTYMPIYVVYRPEQQVVAATAFEPLMFELEQEEEPAMVAVMSAQVSAEVPSEVLFNPEVLPPIGAREIMPEIATPAMEEKPRRAKKLVNYKKMVEEDARFRSWLAPRDSQARQNEKPAQDGVVLHVFKPPRRSLLRAFDTAIKAPFKRDDDTPAISM